MIEITLELPECVEFTEVLWNPLDEGPLDKGTLKIIVYEITPACFDELREALEKQGYTVEKIYSYFHGGVVIQAKR